MSLGLWKIGAVVAYINTNLRQDSLLHCLNISNAKCLVYSASLAEPVAEIETRLAGSLADAPMFYMFGDNQGMTEGNMEGGRRRNLDRELERASHIAPPPLQDKSFSGRTGVLSAHIL